MELLAGKALVPTVRRGDCNFGLRNDYNSVVALLAHLELRSPLRIGHPDAIVLGLSVTTIQIALADLTRESHAIAVFSGNSVSSICVACGMVGGLADASVPGNGESIFLVFRKWLGRAGRELLGCNPTIQKQ